MGLSNYCFAQSEEDSLVNIINQNRRDSLHWRALNELGSLHGDYDTANSYYQEALALAQSLKAQKFELATYQSITKLNRSFDYTDSALYYGEKATRLAQSLGDGNAVADVHIDIGNVYLNTFNYLKALSEFIAAAKILDSLKTNPKSQMTAYANIGNVQFQLGNYAKAIDYTETALAIAKEINFELGIGYCYKTKGRIFRKQEKFEQATEAYKEALTIYTKLDNQNQISEVLLSIGNLYFDMELFDKALVEYDKSLAIAKRVPNAIPAYSYAAIGSTLSVLKQYPKAMAYFDSTLMEVKGNNPYLEMDSYENLAVITERLGDHKLSLSYYKKFSVLRDSLNTLEDRKVAEEMEAKYQNTSKQNEIELLKKDQQLQAQSQKANAILVVLALFSVTIISGLLINRYRVLNRIKRQAELEHMRQNIARDLHDDIGSTLSSINIMSKLAMQQADNSGHLQKISTYSSRMMETMSDIVWSINPANDSVEQMLVKMKEFAAEILEPNNINYHFNLDEGMENIRLDVEKRKSIFLIFKEAINNIAKYSEATQVNITLSRMTNTLILMVNDNGKGFDVASVTRGNGLKNMAARSSAINGTWKQNSELGKGTTISVEIPIT